MALNIQQQAKEIIERSQNILITCNKNLDGDNIGSAFAFYFLLKKMGKIPYLVLDKNLPEKFNFLPAVKFSIGKPNENQNLVISLDLRKKNVNEVYYEKKDESLKIIISPKDCALFHNDINVANGNATYDLMITLGAPDQESIGAIFEKEPELFHQTPILNIDIRPGNENYGKINFIDLQASSCSEILANFLRSYFENFIDSQIATCLLTGIITTTKNLQNSFCTPRTFTLTSYLMEKGGDQQIIVRFLYKEKGINELKLFGRVLARLQRQEEKDLSFTLLPYYDFLMTGTQIPQLSEVIDNFKETVPHFNPLMILWENDKKEIWGIILCQNSQKMKFFEQKLGGTSRNDRLFFRPESLTLNEAGKEILNLL